jgi:hypothetical protein
MRLKLSFAKTYTAGKHDTLFSAQQHRTSIKTMESIIIPEDQATKRIDKVHEMNAPVLMSNRTDHTTSGEPKENCGLEPLDPMDHDIFGDIAETLLFHVVLCFYRNVYWRIPVIDLKSLRTLVQVQGDNKVAMRNFQMSAILLATLPYLSDEALYQLKYQSRESARIETHYQAEVMSSSTCLA